MHFKVLAFAAATAAFVIVPELSAADEDLIFKALPIHEEVDAVAHSVPVPCRQCQGKDASLSLAFRIANERKLLLNGFEVFPDPDPWHGDLVAAVDRADGETAQRKLGYSLAVSPEASADHDSQLRTLNVELKVIEVGDQFVNGVPAVTVQLAMVPSGEISIVGIEVADDKASSCDSLVCRVKEALAGAFKPFRKCHGQRRPKGMPANSSRPHLKHGHERGRFVTNIAAQILLPVLMGVTAGVGVALVAMAFCSCVMQLTAISRGKSHSRVALCPYSRWATREQADASEKADLLEEAATVPEYDEKMKN